MHYDRKSHVGTLDKVLDQADANGWIIVDIEEGLEIGISSKVTN